MEARSDLARGLAVLVALAWPAAYAVALDRLRRRGPGTAWWASSLRDLVNLAAAAAAAGCLLLWGYPLPQAMVVGTATGLAEYAFDYAARDRRPAWVAGAAGVALSGVELAAGAWIAPALDRALAAAFGG